MSYRSIFLAAHWVHQGYFGSRVIAHEPDIRIRWYDLGGVVNRDDANDPIYPFKWYVGGEFFHLDLEGRHTGRTLELALNFRAPAKRLRGRGKR